jgi:aldehyde dehydrogenase (NAD+)
MMKNIFQMLGLNKLIKNGILPSLYLGDKITYGNGKKVTSFSPIDSQINSSIKITNKKNIENAIEILNNEFVLWQEVPAPKRGELVREFGNLAREYKESLAYIITFESGKIYEESLGEVQELIDVCDFAVGLSRQLYGLSIASERYRHRMIEQWHPLGVVGIISAFNFPMAVWAWNAMIALVCGNTLFWKPSNQTPLCAIALHLLFQKALKKFPDYPQNISCIAIINQELTQTILKNKKVRLISATGSVSMGKKIAPIITKRLGRVLLELGGNNAMIVAPSANLDLTIRAIVFSAVGTSGQRCTSLRRLFVHKSIFDKVSQYLIKAYKSITIGNPFDTNILMGPLVNKNAYENMQNRLKLLFKQDAKILYGGRQIRKNVPAGGFYVKPALVKINHTVKIVQEETFAPILYLIEYEELSDAIKMNNSVPQGLSSAIFTQDLKEAETFMSAIGSDCGIANVNIGTSGAEIGGAFGGEKDTGGGRESGSDAWKNYMRRVTNTINYSDDIPLSQGIKFDI